MNRRTFLKKAFALAEARALYELIDVLSGGNPENVFAWDGTDSLDDASTRASARIYLTCNARVPETCNAEALTAWDEEHKA